MIKEIDEKAVEQELKETKKRINEIEKKELKALRKKVCSMESLLSNSIRCPKCKKLFKEVYVDREFMSTNYSTGGYFGDEVHSVNGMYAELVCPSCNNHWDKHLRTWFGNESSDCDMKHKESLKCKYAPKKVKINSKDEIIFPKKGNYITRLGSAFLTNLIQRR